MNIQLTRRQLIQGLALGLLGWAAPPIQPQAQRQGARAMSHSLTQLAATYSIAAHDPQTGQLGVAVQTHQTGVGRVVPWLEPGVGAIATQSLVNVGYGPNGLTLLRQGMAPDVVIQQLTQADPIAYHRQVGVVGADGRAAAFTGEHCIAYAGHHTGPHYTVQANMMTTDTVIPAMRHAYEEANGQLVDRLMAALDAAQTAGGDIRGMQSAALVIVPPAAAGAAPWDTVYDLRVDDHEAPLLELARLVRLRRAQLISDAGDAALRAGNREAALALWEEARELAPELEELGFWQAIALADAGEVEAGAALFRMTFDTDPRRDYWLDLIGRLETARLISTPGTAAALVAAIEAVPRR